MKTLYALPCACGNSVDVDRSQAGLAVRCPCGRELHVPTIRGFAELTARNVPDAAVPSAWGPRQGVIFLGLAITFLACALAFYLRFLPPPSPVQGVNHELLEQQMAKLTPTESFQMWVHLSQGMDREELPLMLRYRAMLAKRQRWTWVTLGGAGVGLLIAVGGGLMVGNTPRRSPRHQPVGRTT